MYGMVLPRFVAAALADKPLQVYGDGAQTRCFCHVSDVITALDALMQCKPAVGQVFNLGGEDEISILDLAKRVIALTHSSSTIQTVSYEQAYGQAFDDLPRRVPRLDKIQSAIGFRAGIGLEQIIHSVIADQKREHVC